MSYKHRFSSSEREKVEIVASLLQQAGYDISRIQQTNEAFTCTARTPRTRTETEEHERIASLVSHFHIETWSMSATCDAPFPRR